MAKKTTEQENWFDQKTNMVCGGHIEEISDPN